MGIINILWPLNKWEMYILPSLSNHNRRHIWDVRGCPAGRKKKMFEIAHPVRVYMKGWVTVTDTAVKCHQQLFVKRDKNS